MQENEPEGEKSAVERLEETGSKVETEESTTERRCSLAGEQELETYQDIPRRPLQHQRRRRRDGLAGRRWVAAGHTASVAGHSRHHRRNRRLRNPAASTRRDTTSRQMLGTFVDSSCV